MARPPPVTRGGPRQPWPKRPCTLSLLLALLLLPGGAGATDPVANGRTRSTHRYTTRLTNPHAAAKVGGTAVLRFALAPPVPPPGSFVAVKLTPVREPGAAADHPATVLAGFPETSLLFHAPGTYRFAVVVSLVTKSSCGGAEMDTILEGEAHVEVRP